MTFSALPGTLRQLADFAEIRGTSAEARDWRRLADDLEQAGPDEITRLRKLARRNRLTDVPYVQPAYIAWLRDILLGRTDDVLSSTISTLPWLLQRLLEFATVDSAAAATLAREGVVTLPDLHSVLTEGRLSPDLAPLEERLRLSAHMLRFKRPRVTLGRAVEILDNLALLVAAACPDINSITPSGDVRRVEPMVEALVLVAHTASPAAALDALAHILNLQVLHRTHRRALVSFQQLEVDIHIVAPDEFGTALHVATGSRAHLLSMRTRQRSMRLSPREDDVYAHAGLPWIPPELRQGSGEVEAAAEGRLPTLVTLEDIRGDLHMHTTYSDGRDSIAEMLQMATTLGYEYVAITDHSQRAGASKTVTPAALARQRDEIDELRDRFPRLTILHGAEVDIMPDGSLDFDDDVLASLDIVLASLHDSRGHDSARLTRRCLAAIEHPLVNIITHPANRLVGRDEGYDLDFPAIFAAAAATGTALEIDGAPSHLDLDGERARAAVAAGVTVVIDSDCHKARLLDRQMRLGVGTARRGWVEARHVLNTRPIAEVDAFLKAKRQARR